MGVMTVRSGFLNQHHLLEGSVSILELWTRMSMAE